ncbi:hypothetical protein SDC9_102919 [bioreactor metagenome]|uniref:Uncharacterized protein n=1 Tax=bioreactor metagenome TaxID=1076179 RepID=A0A645ASN3_9ZZZZ
MPHGQSLGRRGRLGEFGVFEIGRGRNVLEDVAHLVQMLALRDQKARGFGQTPAQHRQQSQRHDAAHHQHGMPAVGLHQGSRCQAAQCRAQGEAAEHGGHHDRAAAVGAVFRGECDRIGHGAAQAQAGDEPKDHQRLQIGRERRQQAHQAENEHRHQEHGLASEAVCKRADQQGAQHQAEQTCAEHRCQLRGAELPFGPQRRRNEANGRRVETVDGNDQKAQHDDVNLVARQLLLVDEGGDVNGRVARHGDFLRGRGGMAR